MSLNDYYTMEKIMEAWYEAGKYEATLLLDRKEIRYDCDTVDLHEDDRVIYMKFLTTVDGVERIELQSIDRPYASFGSSVSDRYVYEDDEWFRFDNGTDLAGFWSYVDPQTGHLNALGIVERDSVCT